MITENTASRGFLQNICESALWSISRLSCPDRQNPLDKAASWGPGGKQQDKLPPKPWRNSTHLCPPPPGVEKMRFPGWGLGGAPAEDGDKRSGKLGTIKTMRSKISVLLWGVDTGRGGAKMEKGVNYRFEPGYRDRDGYKLLLKIPPILRRGKWSQIVTYSIFWKLRRKLLS